VKLWVILLSLLWPLAATGAADYPPVVPGYALSFPADEGSHPDFRNEWWYVTGWLQNPAGQPLGFQVTFFRNRLAAAEGNPSRFSPVQVLVAHAAISDPVAGHLVGDQRTAREGFGLAQAAIGKTDVRIDDWSLRADRRGYRTAIPARDFRLDLRFEPVQAPLLNGVDGFSQKGPNPVSASYYYSMPQLMVRGTVARKGRTETVTGVAWLDHEWSSAYLDKRAVGWDWIGINLADGGALMAFRMRGKLGEDFWAGGTYRHADGSEEVLAPGDIRFTPLRHWRSPRSGADYPVAWRVQAGTLVLDLEPLIDNQENDTRASVGTLYWEGAVRALKDGRPAGQGYLELTGYWRPMGQ
jgi:predicted secreted hydrolase